MSILRTVPEISLGLHKYQCLQFIKQNMIQTIYTQIQYDKYYTHLSSWFLSCYMFADQPLHH